MATTTKQQELIESLLKCTVNGNIVALPTEMLDNYKDVRYALEKAGGKYKKNTFVFPEAAQPYIDRLTGGEKVNIKKEFQFFETPPKVADLVVELAEIQPKQKVCEPSGGQGALMKAMWRQSHGNLIWTWELMDANRKILQRIHMDVHVAGEDFTQATISHKDYFDRVIANPPFSKSQDIRHIKMMYYVCKPGGRIVSIASTMWRENDTKENLAFRAWLKEVGGVVERELPHGTFKESGTNFPACIVVINK